jgi:endonuclease/exonuclease/phosphatase family metal-dependent hydrolase
MASVSVLTLNIWNYEGPWEQRLALIRKWLGLLDPDLVGLQEVLSGNAYDQAAELFEGFDYHREYSGPMAYWNDPSLKFGNLVASRWPITEAAPLLLPMAGLPDQRVLLCTRIRSPHGTLPFYTTHLTSKPEHGYVREQQVKAIGENILARHRDDDLPAVLCGDFNAAPDSAEMRYLRGLQSLDGTSTFMLDAFQVAGEGEGCTFTRRTPYRSYRQYDQRLDYIYLERSPMDRVRIDHCSVVCDLPGHGVYPSDHFGVYMELELPGA